MRANDKCARWTSVKSRPRRNSPSDVVWKHRDGAASVDCSCSAHKRRCLSRSARVTFHRVPGGTRTPGRTPRHRSVAGQATSPHSRISRSTTQGGTSPDPMDTRVNSSTRRPTEIHVVTAPHAGLCRATRDACAQKSTGGRRSSRSALCHGKQRNGFFNELNKGVGRGRKGIERPQRNEACS